GELLTTIGFLKEAPQVTAHGFNIYHKNRLIRVIKKLRPTESPQDSPLGMSTGSDTLNHGMPNDAITNLTSNQSHPCLVSAKAASAAGLSSKRKEHSDLDKLESVKWQAGSGDNVTLLGHSFETEAISDIANQLEDPDVVNLIKENNNFRAKCLEYKKRREVPDLKDGIKIDDLEMGFGRDKDFDMAKK
ncbi:unnamed protein product, partial [Dovyalis caffra]